MMAHSKKLCSVLPVVCVLIFCANCSLQRDSNPGAATRRTDAASASETKIRYAKGFTLEQRRGYKLLRVLSPWRNAKTSFAYALVPQGSNIQEVEPGAMRVETPVRRIILGSTTFVVYFPMLGIEDAIAGIAGCNIVTTPSVAARIQGGRIPEVGDGSNNSKGFNMERLFNLQPDLVMVFGTGDSQYDQHDKLQEANFRVAINSEYMETTPLGRTEWIKFIAAFFDKEAEAERLFENIADRYKKLAAKTRAVSAKPTVFCNADYRGSWHVPGGNSYVASFIHDAGAKYLWDDDQSTGGMPMNIESVLARAKDADFWLTPGGCRSREELSAMDERYSIFRAFRTGNVFNNIAKMASAGGNDIWEGGIAHPDMVLADLISIFHPELQPDHQRIWYWQLPEKALRRK